MKENNIFVEFVLIGLSKNGRNTPNANSCSDSGELNMCRQLANGRFSPVDEVKDDAENERLKHGQTRVNIY